MTRNIPFIFIVWFFYLSVFAQYTFQSVSTFTYGIFTTITQCVTGLLTFLILFKFCRKEERPHLNGYILATLMLILAVADLTYGIILNVLMNDNLRNSNLKLLYSIPYALFWVISSLCFLSLIKFESFKFKVALATIFSVFFAIFAYDYAPTIYNESLTGLNRFIHITGMTNKILILSICSMLLIFSHSKSVLYFCAGYLVIISYGLLLEYLEIIGKLSPGLPTEIFWSIGLLLFRFGAVNLSREPQIFFKSNTDLQSLRSKIFIWGFLSQFVGLVGWMGFEKLWPRHFSLSEFSRIIAWVIIVFLFFILASIYIKKKFIVPLTNLSNFLKNFDSESKPSKITKFGITEYDELMSNIYQKLDLIRLQQSKNLQLSKLAAEMSHDIRSPLTALKLLSSKHSDVSERTRLMMDQISSRIHNIADNLLKVRKGRISEEEESIPYLIVESILAEKKVSTGNKIQMEFIPIGEVYLKTVKLSKQSLARILSNLINNSIDAFNLNNTIVNPRISIFITNLLDKKLRITIQDNAGGMPPETLQSIKNQDYVSLKEAGNGIGLNHAQEVIKTCDGNMEIISELGYGTVVDMYFPISESPPWLATQIDLKQIQTAVIIDDDPSIHSVWDQRLSDYVSTVHFNSGLDFVSHESFPENTLYLIDYEFRNEELNGINLIELAKIKKNVFLVTSHYDDSEIIDKAYNLQIKILPKFSAPFIKLQK